MRDYPEFSNGNSPIPIVVARTWDLGFLDLKLFGSDFTNGQLANNATWIQGYDNTGFITRTTLSYHTSLMSNLLSLSSLPSNISLALAPIVSEITKDEGFVACLEPNPSKDWNPSGNVVDAGSDSEALYLVDCGTDEQNLPLQPLIQPARVVDVIVAVDSPNDINRYPNGSAIYATYLRSQNPISNGTAFSKVPGANTFVNLGPNQ